MYRTEIWLISDQETCRQFTITFVCDLHSINDIGRIAEILNFYCHFVYNSLCPLTEELQFSVNEIDMPWLHLTETVRGPETGFLHGVAKDKRSVVSWNQPIKFDLTAQSFYEVGEPFVYTANARVTSLKILLVAALFNTDLSLPRRHEFSVSARQAQRWYVKFSTRGDGVLAVLRDL